MIAAPKLEVRQVADVKSESAAAQRRCVSFDLDCTLADTFGAAKEIARERLGVILRKEDVKDYDFTKSTPLTRGQADKLFTDVWDEPENIRLEHSSIPSYLRLLRLSVDIHIATANLGRDQNVIIRWLRDNKIYYDRYRHFLLTDEKAMVDSDIHADDDPVVQEARGRKGLGALVVTQPWNELKRRRLERYSSVQYADRWEEIPHILEEMLGERT
jgi:5'(3')-deoxyribonucleotidase